MNEQVYWLNACIIALLVSMPFLFMIGFYLGRAIENRICYRELTDLFRK
jgi:hypothetical protein